jgi:hypothetical protein
MVGRVLARKSDGSWAIARKFVGEGTTEGKMVETPCMNGRRSKRLENAVHFVERYVPLVDASASHVWAIAGVECKLHPPMPIRNYHDARDAQALFLSYNIKYSSQCDNPELKTCRLLAKQRWCCVRMAMLR